MSAVSCDGSARIAVTLYDLVVSYPVAPSTSHCCGDLHLSYFISMLCIAFFFRGALSSAAPGATVSTDKPPTFNHPTWAVKRLCSVTTLEEVRATHLKNASPWGGGGGYIPIASLRP